MWLFAENNLFIKSPNLCKNSDKRIIMKTSCRHVALSVLFLLYFSLKISADNDQRNQSYLDFTGKSLQNAGNISDHSHVHVHKDENTTSSSSDIAIAESIYFISSLFAKYSKSKEVLTLDGFASLLCSLGYIQVTKSLEADDKYGAVNLTKTNYNICRNITFTELQAQFSMSHHLHEEEHHEQTETHKHEPVSIMDSSPAESSTSKTAQQRRKREDPATNPTLHLHLNHNHCFSPLELLQFFHIPLDGSMAARDFLYMCPALIYQMDSGICSVSPNKNLENHSDVEIHYTVSGKVWGFSTAAVIVISLVGLLGVAVIPIMQKVFYNHLLQLLVALAVGALSGDALLHLLPHAFQGDFSDGHDHDHDHDHDESEAQHQASVWKGLIALLCIFFFFLIERILTIVTDKKRREKTLRRKKKKHCERLCDIERSNAVGAKLTADVETDDQECDKMVMVVHPNKALKAYADATHDVLMHQCDESFNQPESLLDEFKPQFGHSHGQGHAHALGHVHCDTIPGSVAAVAWMVILGDGIHNFSDGLAIGAAFANSVSGGISTSIAVFCHELPHEIGDFAVLLRAGMSVKQAIVYNCVSSILCFIGMLIGVAIGNIRSASLWVFAGVGGMFLYISMVDMLPEMTAVDTKKGENQYLHLFLQVCGMLAGAGIMLLIAIFEHSLQNTIG